VVIFEDTEAENYVERTCSIKLADHTHNEPKGAAIVGKNVGKDILF
jgi:hypothetical protein